MQSTPAEPDGAHHRGSLDDAGPEDTEQRTYVEVAAVPGDWSLAATRQQRRQQRQQQQPQAHSQRTDGDTQALSNNRGHNTSLTGLKSEQSVDMYVENIERRPGDQLKDIADRVRRYCREKGIRIMQARVITNRRCNDVVGCRITIPSRQSDDVLWNRMWPDDVICRRWRNQQGLRAGRRQQYRGEYRERHYQDYEQNNGYYDNDTYARGREDRNNQYGGEGFDGRRDYDERYQQSRWQRYDYEYENDERGH